MGRNFLPASTRSGDDRDDRKGELDTNCMCSKGAFSLASPAAIQRTCSQKRRSVLPAFTRTCEERDNRKGEHDTHFLRSQSAFSLTPAIIERTGDRKLFPSSARR